MNKPIVLSEIELFEENETPPELSGLPDELIEEAVRLAAPKAIYLDAPVTGRGEDWVELAGVRFHSRVMSVNLEGLHRAFPFVAACGAELERWSEQFTVSTDKVAADAVLGRALFAAVSAIHADVAERFGFEKLGSMNPGSLEDWPLAEQRALFGLLGDAESAGDVRWGRATRK